MNAMIQRIFLNLLGRFQISNPPINPPTDVDVWERPLRALDLITRLTNATVSTGSYELFNTIMASAVEQERKMEAARLALHAAYPRGPGTVPPAQDPKLILNFLRSHVDPTVRRIDDAISSAMHAIDSASDNPDSRSWTWRIENAGELLDRFEGSPRPEEFKWWFGVLWLHYGGLDPDVQRKIEEIGKSGDARVDLKQYRIAIVKEIERVKGLDGATDIIRDLEGAYDRLTALIDPWEKVSGEFSSVWTGLISFVCPVATLAGSSYRTGLPATISLSRIVPSTFIFFSPSIIGLCVPDMLYHFIPCIITCLVLKPIS